MARVSAAGTRAREVALVTGGSSGIGLELTKLLRNTHLTYSLDIKQPECSLNGIRHVHCNITSEESVRNAIGTVERPIDLLVNNAGIRRHGSLDGIRPRDFEELLKTNLFGTWLVTTQALKRLAEKPTVLLVSSERALYPRKDVGGYGFVKEATMEPCRRRTPG
jgi:NAD(P)-dependent dehydrogenase (short-subunit alcohol dehydrogenase family)